MKKSKGLRALIAIVICFTVIFGGGVCVLTVFQSIALKTTYKGTSSLQVFHEEDTFIDDSTFVTIEKDPEKDFVILNITDTHLSDFDYRLFTGYFALRDIKRLVKNTKPDLITLSGDLVCAKSEYNSVRKLTETMNSFKIPWAPIFGNHDGEAENIDKDYLAEVMMGKKDDPNNYCLMKKGPNNLGGEDDSHGKRVGNYVINIVEKGTGKLAQSLIMMDSGRDQLTQQQVAWYEQNMRTIYYKYGKKGPIHSTLILHIPLAQYSLAYMEGYNEKKKEWRDDYKSTGAYGDCFEDVCCHKRKFKSRAEMVQSDEYKNLLAKYPEYRNVECENYFFKNGVPIDNGMFDSLKKFGTENVVCGHDHLNCFFTTYQGVNLIYSLKNGMGSGYKVGRNGGTILTVSGNTLKTSFYNL